MSKHQGVVAKAKVKDLKETNQTLGFAKENAELGLTYHSGAINWDNAVIVTVTDASFAQETEHDADGKEKAHRTQKAFMNLLVDPEIMENDSAGCHVWSWKSTTDKRVCRSTLQGEAHGLLSGTEMGDRLRAIIADCRGLIPDLRNWQEASVQHMRHIWLSDCESLVSHLKNPRNERLENVRLSIDIEGLKQMLWEKQDGTSLDELLPERICENAVRWIDTSCMIVDCLTKKMDPSVLLKVMNEGQISLQPTVESELSKLRKRKGRKAKQEAKAEAARVSAGLTAMMSYLNELIDDRLTTET